MSSVFENEFAYKAVAKDGRVIDIRRPDETKPWQVTCRGELIATAGDRQGIEKELGELEQLEIVGTRELDVPSDPAPSEQAIDPSTIPAGVAQK